MDLTKGDVKPLKGYHAGGMIRFAFYKEYSGCNVDSGWRIIRRVVSHKPGERRNERQ